MTDWIEHNGGPQPVDDNVWVEVNDRVEGYFVDLAQGVEWKEAQGYRILNQHLVDAARLEGIRLGLEAAATTVCRREIEAARELEQDRKSTRLNSSHRL